MIRRPTARVRARQAPPAFAGRPFAATLPAAAERPPPDRGLGHRPDGFRVARRAESGEPSRAVATAPRPAAVRDLLPPADRTPAAAPIQRCPQCGKKKCKAGEKCGKFQYIESRSGNPTAFTKKRARIDDPFKFDAPTKKKIKRFTDDGGKNVKGTSSSDQVDMAHKTSDKALRRISDDLIKGVVQNPKPSKKRLKRETKHVDRYIDAHWDSKEQTKSQTKKVETLRNELKSVVTNRSVPSKKKLKSINTGIKTLSTSSLVNLRPGGHITNVKRGQKPDPVVYLGGKNKGNLSPRSERTLDFLEQHQELYPSTFSEVTVPPEIRRDKKTKKFKAKKGFSHSGGTLQ